MRGLEWTNEQTLYFIELYEKLPVLWDPKHPEHKNRVTLSETWVDLQRQFDESIPIKELKKKKESLMSSYRPLKKKVLDSKSAGRTEDVFKPTWYAYEALDRFLGSKRGKKSISNSEDCWDRETKTVNNIHANGTFPGKETVSMCSDGLEWTSEQTMLFIELYENFPILWDPKHPEHKTRLARNKAWKELQKQFDESIPVVELKKKKETLMSRYRPLKKRVLDSKSEGKRVENIFKPMWYAYDVMDRFLGSKGDKKPTFNSEDSWDEETETVNEIHNSQASLQEDDGVIICSDNTPVENHDFKPFLKPKEVSELKNKVLHKKRKDSSQSDMLIANSLKEVAKAITTLPSWEYQQQDQCSIFGQLIASQLRQLSPKNRVKAQVRLSGAIGEVLLEELEQRTSASTSQASENSDCNSSN